MGIGEEFAKQAQERAKYNKAMNKAFGASNEEQGDYFNNGEPDEALIALTEANIWNPLHWTQYERNKPKTDDQEVQEFLSKDTSIKKVDDYFK